ncbi:phage tail tape measure protein [uncultured Selenomonas sp.]|uniref:phage tail tape measure protein n=1 Tax=uncultured Selenomonas sp. TaxID=159275 RepID=UPI0025853044|nr:phage tail tape measure protein [uncultured Selenomonas sp.]
MSSEEHVIDITVQTHDKVGPGLEKAQGSLRNFDKSIEKTQARLTKLARSDYEVAIRAIDRVTPAGSRIRATLHGITGRAYNATIGAVDRSAAKVREAQARLMALTSKAWTVTIAAKDTIKEKASGAVSGAVQSVTGMGVQMMAGAGIGYGIYDTIKTYMDFEAQMKKVQAISGASGSEFEALTAKAKEMGAATQFSATEAGQALEYMAMAGWKTDDMISGISGIMDLAAASGEDLGKVSDIVTDALTAFGLKASDSAHFADVLAAASSNSNTNVGMMGETFKYVAPIAGALGYSAEDTAVAIGLMANAGIKGSDAGTALRATMTRLVDPPKDAAEALNALGISVRNSDGTMKPFMQTMKELRSKFSGLSQAEKAQMASSIAGQEAMSGFLAIVNASDSDFEKLTDSIYNADGAAAKMAATMNDNLKGDLKALSSVWESFQLEIMSGKGGDGLRSFVQGAKTDLEKFTSYIKDGFDISDVGRLALDILTQLKNKFLEFDGIGSILAGGALAGGLLKIISLAKKASDFVRKVTDTKQAGGEATKAVKSMVVNATNVVVNGNPMEGGGTGGGAGGPKGKPSGSGGGGSKGKPAGKFAWGKWLGRGAAALTAVAGAYDAYSTYKDNERLTEEAQYAVDSGAQDSSYLDRTKQQNTDRLGASVGSTGGALAGGILGAKAGAAAGGAIGSLFGGVGAVPGAAIGGVVGGIGGGIAGSEAGQMIGGNISEMADAVSAAWGKIKDEAANTWQWISNGAGQAWDSVSQGAGQLADTIGQTLSGIAESAGQEWQSVKDSAGQAWDEMSSSVGEALQPIIEGVEDVINFIVGLWALLWEQEEPYVDAGIEYISAAWDSIAETAGEAWDGITSMLGEAWDGLVEIVSSVAESVGEVLSEAWSYITEEATAAWEAIAETASAAWDGITGAFSSLADWFVSSVWQPIADFASAAWTEVQAIVSAAWDGVCAVWGVAAGWFMGSVWGPISSAVSSVESAIVGAFQAAYSAVTGIFSGLASWFESNVIGPVKAKFAEIRDLGSSITGLAGSRHAAGGIFNVPHQALVAEDGPEAIIPLNDHNRGLDILQKAASMIGVDFGNEADFTDSGDGGAIVPAAAPAINAVSAPVSPVSVSVSLGGVSIPITVSGASVAPQDVAAAIRGQLEDIADDIGGQLATKVASIFGNTPVMNAQ